MQYSNILKYMLPTKIIQYKGGDIKDIQYIHYPWMKDMSYKDAFLATQGLINSDQYDQYIDSILLDKVGLYVYMDNPSSYNDLVQYIRKDPNMVYKVLNNDTSPLEVQSVLYNN